jgi:Predicted ATPase (AAA+ superfamily)
MDQFVNRIEELDRLQTLYESGTAELAIIYGRRQIGKSELVRQSIADRDDAVYYQAVQGTATTQLRRFVEAAASTYPDITAVKEEWEPLLTYLTDRDAVIVIDEFPYLIESNEGLPSVIQHLWDTAIDESQATLVLTGSAIGMIHTHVLDGGAPLYGRVSQTPNGRLELTQLPFRSIQEFVPTYDPEERVFVYGVFGGTPRYLSPLDPSQSLGENITRLLCDPNGPLHDEPETVLQMELNEVNTYFSVLESMASGNRSRNEIAQGAGIESTNTSYYFDRLETLQIIEKHHPALADPARSKRTRYKIRDPVFRFIPVSLRPRGAVRTLRRERLRGSHRTGIARLRQRNVRIALSPGGTGALCRLPAHTGAEPVVVQEPGGGCRRTNRRIDAYHRRSEIHQHPPRL